MDTDMSFVWKGREEDFFGVLGYEGFVAELRRAYGTSSEDTEMTFVNDQGVSAWDNLAAALAPQHNNQTPPQPPRDTRRNTNIKGKSTRQSTRRHSLPEIAAKQPKSGGRRQSTQLPRHNVNPDSSSPIFPL
ncbi:hypothetical protein FS749_006002 [Ceratobasidium sp. UAMH 11750]|nr:hypothetical protein FS749_006002 [Ceratobasidium sp. UAMH 11750]